MDLDEMKRMAESNGALREAARSAGTRKLFQEIGGGDIEGALKRGDTAALGAAFQKLLSTPEGKALAEQVRKAVGQK